MSDDFDVVTGPAAPLRPVPPANLPSAPPQPALPNGPDEHNGSTAEQR
jgi:hypothetical protein